jgi:hypothetical protein
MSGEVIFMNKQGVHSIDGKGVIKPLFHSVKTDEQKKADFEAWGKMPPVYFQTWVWQEICRRMPLRYKMFLPIYHGQKVVLT